MTTRMAMRRQESRQPRHSEIRSAEPRTLAAMLMTWGSRSPALRRAPQGRAESASILQPEGTLWRNVRYGRATGSIAPPCGAKRLLSHPSGGCIGRTTDVIKWPYLQRLREITIFRSHQGSSGDRQRIPSGEFEMRRHLAAHAAL